MSDAVNELSERYTARHPDAQLRITTASSGTLAAQILKGAPVDILLSASERQADRVAEALPHAEAPRPLCSNALVLALPAGRAAEGAEGLELLTREHIRSIGMGNPDYVPAGYYARTLLNTQAAEMGIEAERIYGSNVRQVLAWLTAGEVDAAFVYATDAALVDGLRIAGRWERIEGRAIRYSSVLIGDGEEEPAARSVVDFIHSPEGAAILEGYGFRAAASGTEDTRHREEGNE
jgi:molybdate transport system substrate-binding protein